ncbi:MAG: class I tRNA ligase family protein, partial [Clostridia bacterium]|nr:class I tRNA ligase family protein [Clostridia bacterium]
EYIPERFAKIYLNWMENIQDWCISRQLWWGHRIPVYYCQDCGEIVAAEDTPEKCPKCGKSNFKQEEDVLDTWFSSALWPFSTLGWPEKTDDLEYFYPTNVLVTAYDIITFWVSKMIFSALEFMDEKPFKYVLIHGLVRDEQGRKMSKSLGNGIDPLEIVDQYGADALRFTLATGNSPGNDMRFSEKRVEASRNFANKIWNAARFILMNLDIEDFNEPDLTKLEDEDKWILNAYNTLVGEVTDNIEKYELGIAVAKLYDFIWDVFCDWYIEMVKPRLSAKGTETNLAAQNTIVYVFSNTLKLLHPIMPFITEEIWLTLPHIGESIMISSWPTVKDEFKFEAETEKINCIIDAIKAIRNRRAEMNVAPSRKAHVYIETAYKDIYKDSSVFFEKLASASGITLTDDYRDENSVTIITDNAKFYIPLNEMLDYAKELERLTKEKEKTQSEIDRIEKKLSNESFVAKAPAAVVAAENEKLEKYKETMANILSAIERIK